MCACAPERLESAKLDLWLSCPAGIKEAKETAENAAAALWRRLASEVNWVRLRCCKLIFSVFADENYLWKLGSGSRGSTHRTASHRFATVPNASFLQTSQRKETQRRSGKAFGKVWPCPVGCTRKTQHGNSSTCCDSSICDFGCLRGCG